MEKAMTTRMMAQLARSPTAPDTMAATIRIATSGSTSRRRIFAPMWRRAGSATTFRPISSRRRCASTVLNPVTVVPSFDRSSDALAHQKLLSSVVGAPARSAGQSCLHHPARLGHVHLPGIFAAQYADDLAHVLHAGGAGLLHRRVDRRRHFGVRHLLG